MKTIKVENYLEIPRRFTGIAEWPDGTKQWYFNGKFHRIDGPAWEYADGTKQWWLDDYPVCSFDEPIGECIVLQEGLPSMMEWLGKPVSTLKVLTAEGICFIPNLPGIINYE